MSSRFRPPTNDPQSNPQCQLRHDCKLVLIGKCPNRHRECNYGILCYKLKKRQCTYYHPPSHFEQESDKNNDNKFLHPSPPTSKTNNTYNNKFENVIIIIIIINKAIL